MAYTYPNLKRQFGQDIKTDYEKSILTGKNIPHIDFSAKPQIVSDVVNGRKGSVGGFVNGLYLSKFKKVIWIGY